MPPHTVAQLILTPQGQHLSRPRAPASTPPREGTGSHQNRFYLARAAEAAGGQVPWAPRACSSSPVHTPGNRGGGCGELTGRRRREG